MSGLAEKERGRVDRLLDTLYNLSEEKEAFFIIQKMKKLFSVKLSKSNVILIAAGLAFGRKRDCLRST
jgi:phenylalanine-4-hydroxylase